MLAQEGGDSAVGGGVDVGDRGEAVDLGLIAGRCGEGAEPLAAALEEGVGDVLRGAAAEGRGGEAEGEQGCSEGASPGGEALPYAPEAEAGEEASHRPGRSIVVRKELALHRHAGQVKGDDPGEQEDAGALALGRAEAEEEEHAQG